MLFSPDSSLQHLNNIFTSKKKLDILCNPLKNRQTFTSLTTENSSQILFSSAKMLQLEIVQYLLNVSVWTEKLFFEWSFNFIVDFCDAIFVSFQLEKMLKFFFVFPRWYQIRKLFIFLKWFFNLASQTQNLGAQMKVFKVKIAVNFLLRL